MKKFAAASLTVAALSFALVSAPAAQATNCGTPSFYINTESALVNYGATGNEISSVALTLGYGDIALSTDHTKVYGVSNGSNVDDDTIDVITTSTGSVEGTITINGAAQGVGAWVGATATSDGKLIIGSNSSSVVYKVNLSDGSSEVWVDLADADSNISATAGDFALLPDGDYVGLGYTSVDETKSALVRIHYNTSSSTWVLTQVGLVPNSWGAGRIGDSIFMAGADGSIYRLDTVPSAASSSALATIKVKTLAEGSLWGGAGTQDSETGSCPLPAPASLAATGSSAVPAGLGLGFLATGVAALAVAARRRRA